MSMWPEIRALINRIVVTRSDADDDVAVPPHLQVSWFGEAKEAEILNSYGFHSIPPVGSTGLVFSQSANQDAISVIAYLHDARPAGLEPGEAVVGNFVVGSIVKFLENGDIEITGKNDLNVTIDGAANITVTDNTTVITPLFKIDGNLEVTGTTTLGDTVTSNSKDISDTHLHSGVTSGGANTGPPT